MKTLIQIYNWKPIAAYNNNKKCFTGPKWFKKFGMLGPDDAMSFPTDEDVYDFQNVITDLNDWGKRCQMHIQNENHGDRLASANQIIFMETHNYNFDGKNVQLVVSIHVTSIRQNSV